MVIWINGAFGAGKSTTTNELITHLKNPFVFDPENVGFFINKNLPDACNYQDFQDHPLWRKQVLENLIYCDTQCAITIVPMTIVNDDIFDHIIGGLILAGRDVRHFTLMATKATLEYRLTGRGDEGMWCFQQIDRCLSSLSKSKYAVHINTDQRSVTQVTDEIVSYLNN